MPDYRFIIEDQSGRLSGTGIQTTPESVIPTGASPTAPTLQPLSEEVLAATDNSFAQGLGTRLSRSAAQQLVSPLNSATGGLATPVYQLGHSVMSGASSAAIGAGVAGVAVAAVMLVIRKLQERVAKMEAQAEAANSRDNLLIRMGMVSQATQYGGRLTGVRKITRS